MSKYVNGQRWISETEPELGLGTITEVDHRRTTVSFFGSNAKRQYATAAAPLKRVRFRPGDEIECRDDVRVRIDTIRENNGLLIYIGNGTEIHEYDICDTISFSTPKERLINGLVDSNKMFRLRYDTLNFMAKTKRSSVRGFVGGRVDLIDHQFFIASQVASRHIPRVLLSDEVGLGKTIEAGLLLHRQLGCERIRRVLIIVPDSLVHQWFVELWRRFNLLFRIFDEAYCRSAEKQDPGMNPFLEYQLGICSIGFFKNKRRKQQAINAGWDMLVVDEAHHIVENSPFYGFIESLGQVSSGMMLLTATPDQMGERSHFARLRLLDPARYHDFEAFAKSAHRYEIIAELIDLIVRDRSENFDIDQATSVLGLRGKKEQVRFKAMATGSAADREKMVSELLDRYGTGRVIFRNTRAAIGWFPKRLEKIYPLEAPPEAIWQAERELLNELSNNGNALSEDHLSEVDTDGDRDNVYAPDYRNDPRIQFLVGLSRNVSNEKILVICRSREKAAAIESAIIKQVNIKIALFTETMTLIQRDRRAAWFSDEKGAQIMICSEIGSEGRNFQFAHHMVMFDLPLNPELLEQRLGRLDRIGQTRDISIHVPYLMGSAQEILVNWFSRGLDIFENTVDGLYYLYKQFGPQVADLLTAKIKHREIPKPDVTRLINETIAFRSELSMQFENGRNRMLELNSFHAGRAKKLTDEIRIIDESRDLDHFMLRVFDHYGIRTDEISDRTWRLHFNDLTGSEFPMPALGENKRTATFDRKKALVRGEIDFLSWDHPMVTGAMELLLGSEKGNSAIALWENSGKQGILLESIFVFECVAPSGLHIDRFLPPKPLRMVVDSSGNNVTKEYPVALFDENLEDFDGAWLTENQEITEIFVPEMINASFELAETSARHAMHDALAEIESVMGEEIRRLKNLQQVNPNIRVAEIESMEQEKQALGSHMRNARFRLDALRIVLMM